MNRPHARYALALLALAAFGGCAATGSAPPVVPASGGTAVAAVAAPPPYRGPKSLAAFAWGKPFLSGAHRVRAIASGTFAMGVLVNQRDAAGLIRYAHDVSDPHSARYRRFLTPSDIAARFGASAADYRKAARYFARYGLHVGGWKQRQTLFVDGTVRAFEKALGTTFAVWQKGDERFIAPNGTPHLATAEPIAAISGMVRDPHLRRADFTTFPNGSITGYAPQQVARAFDYTGAYSGGVAGYGIDVAIVGTGPIDPRDAATYRSRFNVPLARITQVDATDAGVSKGLGLASPSPLPSGAPQYPYSSGLQSPPPVTAPCGDLPYPGYATPACNPEDTEAQLDTQTIASLAPGAHVLFYLAYNQNDCYVGTGEPQHNQPCVGFGEPAEGILLTDPEIQQIIADDKADVVSMSFGKGEPYGIGVDYDASGVGFVPVEMATMVAEGMAVFASSGDYGAYTCGGEQIHFGQGSIPCVSYPASDSNVVGVGGVTAPLYDDGALRTEITTWGFQTTGGYEGSGGGISTVFPAPAWQPNVPGSGGFRTVPDVSMLADPQTGVAVIRNAGFGYDTPTDVGGTSLAAPQMAAMWALVLQACAADAACRSHGSGPHGYRLGNPAPLLYAILKSKTYYPKTFYDVIYGNNGNPLEPITPPSAGNDGYSAKAGYDLTTGIGVPFAGHLIDAVIAGEGGRNPNLP